MDLSGLSNYDSGIDIVGVVMWMLLSSFLACSSRCEKVCSCVVKEQMKIANKGVGVPQQIAEANNKKKVCLRKCSSSVQTIKAVASR